MVDGMVGMGVLLFAMADVFVVGMWRLTQLS